MSITQGELRQVKQGGASTGNYLKWDGSSWAPSAPDGVTGNLQWKNSNAFGSSSVLTWDDSNKRLGVNTSGPNGTLDVKSTGNNGTTSSLIIQDSGPVTTLQLKDNGELLAGKDYTTGLTAYSTIKSGNAGTVTITNNSGSGNTSLVNILRGGLVLAGADPFTQAKGIDIQVLNTNTSTSNIITGINVIANLNSAGARASTIVGAQILATSNAATGGSIGEITGLKVRTRIQNASVTASAVYGIYIEDLGNTGTMLGTYGLYIGDMTTGTQSANTAYSIYSQDTNSLSYIGGKLGIGTLVPTAYLHLPAGAPGANTAAFKMTTGSLLSSAEQGAWEFDNSGSTPGLFFTPVSIRRQVALWGYRTATTTLTAGDDDFTIDCTSGTFTVTLPACGARIGRVFVIKNSGAGTITIDPTGAETINGAATYTLVATKTVMIQSTGTTNWITISEG